MSNAEAWNRWRQQDVLDMYRQRSDGLFVANLWDAWHKENERGGVVVTVHEGEKRPVCRDTCHGCRPCIRDENHTDACSCTDEPLGCCCAPF